MKKLLIAVVFTCMASVSFAQLNLGVKAGLNFTKLSTSREDLKTSMKPGFDVGLFLRAGLASKLYIQPEVLYSFQSSKIDQVVNTVSAKTHSILVPVLIGYKIFDAKLMNVRVFLGPNFGFIVGNNLKENGSIVDLSVMNIAGDIGVGLDIAMITLDVKYSYGFTKANKNSFVTDHAIDPKYHNNLFSISLGWKFL